MDVNLVLLKNNGTTRRFPLKSSVTVIGRRKDCDLNVPIASISKRHCRISRNNDVLLLHDLKSKNGTFLNGKKIDEAEIKPGDRIKVGPVTFLCESNEQLYSPETQDPPSDSATDLTSLQTSVNPKNQPPVDDLSDDSSEDIDFDFDDNNMDNTFSDSDFENL